jgi:DNA-directed RNA polymerase subunit N (RpoN/RPB10)
LAIYKELVEQGEAQAKNLRELGLENFEQRGIALIGN